MGEKLYKPIIKDGDHLVRSTKNPDRFRGQSRDADNKNPDLIEWEEVDIDNYEPVAYEERQVQLTEEEEKIARELGELLAAGTVWLIGNVVAPWWKETALPWIKDKCHEAFLLVSGQKKTKAELIINTAEKGKSKSHSVNKESVSLDSVSDQIDKAFETFKLNMNEKEARQHLLNIIFHMLEIANEIRILSNAQIQQECENEEQYLERVKASETYLTEKVASNIDKLLSNESLSIDIKTSRDLVALMGGGVRINGEYVPVETPKVYEAILAQDDEWAQSHKKANK